MSSQPGPTDPYRARLDNHVLVDRFAKVEAMRAAGTQPFANGFVVTHDAAAVFALAGDADNEALTEQAIEVKVAGRVRLMRRMGKAMFLKLHDRSCRPGVKPVREGAEDQDDFLQLFVSQKEVGAEAFEALQSLDLGDIIGVSGRIMRTKTGEVSVGVREVAMLTKSVRPMPDKFRGLTDRETRYRQRYVDLMVNDDVREVFLGRSRIVREIRRFFDDRGYLEVETPMLHVQPGGATARPFVTHHNALDMEMYLRIAPELYLKRLLVGGMERVYEINRNFRNEGLSRRHNPEFTMLEFYQAYASYTDLMEMTETLISGLGEMLHGRDDAGRVTVTTPEGNVIDLTAPWKRVTVKDAVAESLGVPASQLDDEAFVDAELARRGIAAKGAVDVGAKYYALFEELCETGLLQPTFIIDFPASVSPLARRKDTDPTLVDRFELFIDGREIANAFNELNDPEDQYGRFAAQLAAREAGDDEAMAMDDDYIRALEYGMPPAAGEGIGIDRLAMLLLGQPSIRDVILFPHMRPEEGLASDLPPMAE